MKNLLLALAATALLVSCGPKKTGEQVAEDVCTCVKGAADAMMADIDKYATADTSSFKAEMMAEANSKLDAVTGKVQECMSKTVEKEENIAALADQKEKAAFDEKSGECTKGYVERAEKAKTKLTELQTQMTAAADSAKAKLEKGLDKAKNAVAKVVPTVKKK